MRKTAIERAFELAKAGQASRVEDIDRRLRDEGYDYQMVRGRVLRKQLSRLLAEARSRRLDPPTEHKES